ncbi:MAG: DUF1572 family protein [Chitinophagaceae bacterium]|nr:DUF1572 family protein [Chitinophagaceae bacterium]
MRTGNSVKRTSSADDVETTERIFLSSAIKRFREYKNLAEKAFGQITEADLFYQPNEESNSIAIIIQHLHGNMMSRWTDLLTTDGEKEWRQRDAEFEIQKLSKEEILIRWQQGWSCFLGALETLSESDLQKIIHIRKEPLTVIDAINRQLAHYSYHIGQIIYVARIIKNVAWETLSIPKNKSREFKTP